jgi:hypothetical protein
MPTIGKTLGHYRVCEQLGGEGWKARVSPNRETVVNVNRQGDTRDCPLSRPPFAGDCHYFTVLISSLPFSSATP